MVSCDPNVSFRSQGKCLPYDKSRDLRNAGNPSNRGAWEAIDKLTWNTETSKADWNTVPAANLVQYLQHSFKAALPYLEVAGVVSEAAGFSPYFVPAIFLQESGGQVEGHIDGPMQMNPDTTRMLIEKYNVPESTEHAWVEDFFQTYNAHAPTQFVYAQGSEQDISWLDRTSLPDALILAALYLHDVASTAPYANFEHVPEPGQSHLEPALILAYNAGPNRAKDWLVETGIQKSRISSQTSKAYLHRVFQGLMPILQKVGAEHGLNWEATP